ncbi:MAG: hypothetical protein R3B46_00685 [Phycisphaerales bacterium]
MAEFRADLGAAAGVLPHDELPDEPFVYDYCNFLSDFFLTDPDDGVVEMVAGQLPGANNMGHKAGWCHTTGMQDPAQYTDTVRNATMNANAAR